MNDPLQPAAVTSPAGPARRPWRKMIVSGAAAGAAIVATVGVTGAADATPARPNLVVSSVEWAPTQPVAGQQARFTAVIRNTGNAPTPQGVISGVGFAVDGALRTWSDTTTSAIQPGQSVTVSANGGPTGSPTWGATAGKHTLRAFVDDAARIAESREDDNTRSVPLEVAAGLSVQTAGTGLQVGMAKLARPSLVTTSVTGDAYAACFTGDGVLVDGTEQYVTTYTVGRDEPSFGGKWFDGMSMVPAGTTQQRVGVSSSRLLYAYQGHFPFACAAGTTAQWSGLHGTSVTATRWPGQFGDAGPALARVTKALDTVFDVTP